ncbi:phosphatidylethanolamine-binding protein [Natrialba chahannaoensis JCM 10990]|uniref:Phosphatidylethanolamine-binding protein n=1 Tax=Natrialba chahannaoensis JCM 10990 TaxID=1227492 RepID=M0AJL2_9EURY|nr:YbhB/YbcL family Raf kinase inhibitor-like protein [Natrialba chahannaoensis]ELY97583.1 phosphatidylethanolamine-binding protein [Natrialba chahannaoensis JCM 10990]
MTTHSRTLTLRSSAFTDGDRIPDQHGYRNANINPPLEFDGVPDGTTSLALIVDDPDAVEPAGKIWDHWLVWNIPPDQHTIPEDWDPETAGAREGTNDFGERGYGGPNPPDREHTYRFRLFALESELGSDLDTETSADDLESAMDGHVIETATLEGTYPA